MAESSGMPPSTLPSRAWRVTVAPLLFAGALSTSGCGSAGDELRIASPGDADAKSLLDVRVEHATQPGESLRGRDQAHDLAVKATLIAIPAGAALIGGVVLTTLPAKWMRLEVDTNGPASAAVSGRF